MALKLNHLNSRQRDAVLHAFGPLLILAGAGSGKTSTMAYRIAHLIAERHVPGDAILGLSFTNKAAAELKERVTKLVTENVGRKATRGLTITTFHSLCARLLRAHADRLGFQTNFTILDQNDQTDVLRQVLRNIRIDDRKFDPDVILFEIGQAKNRFLSASEAEVYFLESGKLAQDYAIAAASAFGHYQDQLKVLNSMDFDDLIYYTVSLLEKDEEIRDKYNYKFRHVLVDEYQDTNAAQFKILKLLTQKQQNLCVVGDDDQSIYAWRGADPTHILGFKNQFPTAQVVSLEQNYRSTSRILEAANHVIEKNSNRYPKTLWSDRGTGEPLTEVVVEDDRAESEFVAEEIVRRTQDQSRAWSDFAILYRSNSQSRVFEEALRRRGIPYKIVGGISFLARKEVKDVLSYWKLVANSKDDASLRRILNWPARGIGKTSVEALGKHAFDHGIPIYSALSEAPKLAPKASHSIYLFRDLLEGLKTRLQSVAANGIAVAEWAKDSLDRIQAKKAIEEECDDPVQAARKWENIDELIHSIGQFKMDETSIDAAPTSPGITTPIAPDFGPDGSLIPTVVEAPTKNGMHFLQEFINRMTLEAQEAEKDEEDKDSKKNQVTLLTLHGAKGLEYPFVFLVGLEEGFLPHKRTLEEVNSDFGEERRLCYVGITRAKDHLFLLRANNRIRYGKPIPRYPSRFLAEIPKDLIVKIHQALTPDLSTKEAKEDHEVKVKNYLADIRAKLTSPRPG
jgi:DNA helicase-2/ATP-dependent DNA helicase PcrA